MKRILPSLPLVSGSPALAHSGAHLHPHGSGHWITIALTLGLVAITAVLFVRK